MRVGLGVSLIEPAGQAADDDGMVIEPGTETLTTFNDDGALTIVRALLLVQVGIIVTATVESAVVGAASPGMAAVPLLNASFAIWTMFLMRGIGQRSARARRWTVRLQIGWVALATIDLLLAVILADRVLEPVPLTTRLLIPVLLIGLLYRPAVRECFEVAP